MDETRCDITKFNTGCALAPADRSRLSTRPGGGTSIDLKMTSPEYSVVKAHIADINRRIPAADVSSYAYDLFQAELICVDMARFKVTFPLIFGLRTCSYGSQVLRRYSIYGFEHLK